MAVSLDITSGVTAGNLEDLTALVGYYINRSDLADRIPGFIEMAERRFNRTLVAPEREIDATVTVAAEVPLPPDFHQLTSIWLNTDPRVPLEQVTPQELRARYSSQTTGRPAVFAISAGNFKFGPAPDSDYTLDFTYIRNIPLLGVNTPSNWLLESHPDIYLYGALVQAEAFLNNDERVPLWRAALDEALAELTDAGNRKRYSAAPLRLRSSVAA